MAESRVKRWQRAPLSFIADMVVDPETGRAFELYPAQVAFFDQAFARRPDGRLKYVEQVYGAPKKSAKSTTAAMWVLVLVLVYGGRFAEGYCVANDFDQAQGRVFAFIRRIVEASPRLKAVARITADTITFPDTGSFIKAIPSDATGAAGSAPCAISIDEPWGFTLESSRRLFDEMVPVPTRKISARLSTSYAGFTGESLLLQELHDRGKKGEEVSPDLYVQPGLLCYWTHHPPAPWQTAEWVDEMRRTMRPSAFARQILNQFVASEGEFLPLDWYDECVDQTLTPLVRDKDVRVWVGLDASTKRDSTAIYAVTFDSGKVKLVWSRTFQPTPTDPLDFETTVEASLLELRDRFAVQEVRYDPWQLAAVAQRMTHRGVPMVEYPQTQGNLTAIASNTYELFKGRNFVLYPDAPLRRAVAHAVAVEKGRGWRIAKERQSQKIDPLIALSLAALGAVVVGQVPTDTIVARNLRDGLPADFPHIRGENGMTYEQEHSQRLRDERSLRGLPLPGFMGGLGRIYGR